MKVVLVILLRSKIYAKNIFDDRESTNSLSELFSIVQ